MLLVVMTLTLNYVLNCALTMEIIKTLLDYLICIITRIIKKMDFFSL